MSDNVLKDYSGGIDASGGFGIPDGNALAPDELGDSLPTIQSKKTKTYKKFLLSVFRRYEDLPKDSTLRKEAESLFREYNEVKSTLVEMQAQVQPIVDAAKEMLNIGGKDIGEDLHEIHNQLLAVYERETQDLDDSEKEEFRNSFGKEALEAIDEFISSYESIAKKYRLSIFDVSENFAAAIDHIGGAYWDYFYNDGHIDYFIDSVSKIMRELEASAESGDSNMSKRIAKQRNVLNSYIDDMDELQIEIQRELIETNRSAKMLERFVDINQTLDDASNYRLAVDTSPRVCGNCRFFKGQANGKGECTAFDFEAQAHYLCDAWQAQQLTPHHTPMRANIDMKYKAKDTIDMTDDVTNESMMINTDNYYEEFEGVVQGERLRNDIDGNAYQFMPYDEPYQHETKDYVDEFTGKFFVPGDIVYSTSLRSLAFVESVMKGDAGDVCGLKLIDTNGTAWGSGTVLARDLQSRSKSAVKRNNQATKSRKGMTAQTTINQMIDTVRDYRATMSDILEDHKDLTSQPLSNQDVLLPLQQDISTTMAEPTWKNIKSGPRRKYYRALQSAWHSIGSARFTLTNAYTTCQKIKRNNTSLNNDTKSAMREVVKTGQRQAYERVKYAYNTLHTSLIQKSEMHDIEAPGLE